MFLEFAILPAIVSRLSRNWLDKSGDGKDGWQKTNFGRESTVFREYLRGVDTERLRAWTSHGIMQQANENVSQGHSIMRCNSNEECGDANVGGQCSTCGFDHGWDV